MQENGGSDEVANVRMKTGWPARLGTRRSVFRSEMRAEGSTAAPPPMKKTSRLLMPGSMAAVIMQLHISEHSPSERLMCTATWEEGRLDFGFMESEERLWVGWGGVGKGGRSS